MSNKISIYRFMSAGCNGCDVEIFECLVPRYKLGELNVEVVSSPEEANVLAITGGINVKGREELKASYEKIQPPKLVVAIGNCALTMEIFDGGYPMVGPPDRIVPVNLYVPGCPPRPQAIVSAIAKALDKTLSMEENYWDAPEGFRGLHEFDGEKCIGCGACAQVCSSKAIDIIDGNEKRLIKVNYGHCSFCAFCQDECPTEAIKLTKKYQMLTDNRNLTNITNEVQLISCSICGRRFMPEPQIEWAIKRVTEKVNVYEKFMDAVRRAMRICPDCRRETENIRDAKKLLLQLSTVARINRK